MEKIAYYALFRKEKDSEAINVVFPDIVAGYTCGDNYDDAVFMAKDLLKLMYTEVRHQVFAHSTYEEIKKDYPNDEIVLIEVEI